jgi:predicted nucleic acid-binding protein
MKVCFDTSVLVAALLSQHPHHATAFPRLKSVHVKESTGFVTTHALAELFAVLTALPLKPKIQPDEARKLVTRNVEDRFDIIELSAKQYSDALDLVAYRGLSSGAIYDALHLIGARAANCGELITFNMKHFSALAPGDPLITRP